MPALRFRCHCTRCQSVYQAPYADALVLRRGQVRLEDPEQVDWMRTMRPSPLVRGLCASCREPVLAHFFAAFSIIPTRLMPKDQVPPVGHDVYYRTRIAGMQDTVPRHDTMIASYLGLALPFARVLALPGRRFA